MLGRCVIMQLALILNVIIAWSEDQNKNDIGIEVSDDKKTITLTID